MKQPLFEALDGPDVRPLVYLHRGHDGFVSFARKVNDGADFENLFSIKAADLEECFPQLLPTFETDSYFSINGMFRPGHGVSKHSPQDLPLVNSHRNADSVRYLTAAFVDIDCTKLGIDVGQAIAEVVRNQDAGTIPPASMLTRSGRGLWCFWFLRDDDHQRKPAPAFPEKVRLWANIQRKIGDTFNFIGADAAARDVARITRIPGSVNTKANLRVDYWIQAGKNAKPFIYTLSELAAALDVQLPTRHPAVSAQHAKLSERGRKGQAGRWIKARRNFETLWELRGTFKIGTRNNALFLYASILRSQHLEEDVVWSECYRLATHLEGCSLAQSLDRSLELFSTKDFTAAVTAGKGYNRAGRFGGMTNQTISDLLNVSPEEAAVLDGWPPASCYQVGVSTAEADQLGRKDRAAHRQRLIRTKVAELGKVPPIRALAAWLDSQGLPTVPATVTADLKALNLHSPRKKKRRARKTQRKLF